jgi:hypothetical protein
MVTMQVTGELRAFQARALKHITTQKPTELPADLKLPGFIEDAFYDGPYAELAKRLNRGLLERAATTRDERLLELSLQPSVRFGLYALCKTLSYAPDAYLKYSAHREESRSTTALGEILLRSAGVVNYFAGVDDGLATVREVNFGLRAMPPTHEENPFLIDDESGAPMFAISPYTAAATELEVQQKIADGSLVIPTERYRKCPAVGIVLTSQWGTAVNRCVEEVQLFPYDLESGIQ